MLDQNSGLAMERSFSVGAPGTGNTIKLYTVDFHGATDWTASTASPARRS
jgi:hypothetical protein